MGVWAMDTDVVHGQFLAAREILSDETALERAHYGSVERVALSRMAQHSATFLARTHPLLGRTGPICPFISGAIRGSHFHLAASRIDEGNAELLAQCTARMLTKCERLTSLITDPSSRMLASAMVVFPYLESAGGIAAIERAQSEAKESFVSRGYMIGEFYPGNTTGGLHSADFHPLDTPVPSLAVRHMHPSDAPFILGDARFETSYLERFGAAGERELTKLLAARAPQSGCPMHRAATDSTV